MQNVQPMEFPPDEVLLKGAKQRWLENENREALAKCQDLCVDITKRVGEMKPNNGAEMYARIQAVISGAVNLREQWTRHLSAVEAIKTLSEESTQENLCV